MPATHFPWVSFCIATYQRQQLLQSTLQQLLAQTFSDFEIIVSDNDPTSSSRDMVESFQDPRIRYFGNQENVGMVKNFNRALAQAAGEYVVMISDDDPVYPEMLSTLRLLVEQYPGYGAYYGAGAIRIDHAEVAKIYARPVGDLPSLSGEVAANQMRIYSAAQFPYEFFRNGVFPYFLWSTGIVTRKIALAIEGMPDFGSPFFTDFGYIILAGSHSGCVTINKALGVQTIHPANFGRKEYAELNQAIPQYYNYMSARLSQRADYDLLRPKFEHFITSWTVGHLAFLYQYFTAQASDKNDFEKNVKKIFSIPYLRHGYFKYVIITKYPKLYQLYLHTRRVVLSVVARLRGHADGKGSNRIS